MAIDLKKALREPMLHFLAIGAGLFIAFGALNPSEAENPDKIIVSSGQIEQLEAGFTKTWSRPPTPQERQRLISEYIRDEVFYREAVNLGLDEGDGVIRKAAFRRSPDPRLPDKTLYSLTASALRLQGRGEMLPEGFGEHPVRFGDQANYEPVSLHEK